MALLNLDAPLATPAGRPIGNKDAKAAQSSVNKCLVEVSSILLIRDKKKGR
jgi:hypothetical protein